MAYIELTKGYVVIVDDDLLEELNQYLWYASGLEGRPARRLGHEEGRRLIYMYHQIMGVKPWELRERGLVIDHINRNPLDNRKENLRLVSTTINARNKDGYGNRRGICYDSRHGKYKVYIDRPDEPRINVGTYAELEVAEQALLNARLELGLENN